MVSTKSKESPFVNVNGFHQIKKYASFEHRKHTKINNGLKECAKKSRVVKKSRKIPPGKFAKMVCDSNDQILIGNPIKAFWEFCKERQSIFEKRKADCPPEQWTNDEILKKAKITNVFREQDRGTVRILNHLISIKVNEKPNDISLFYNALVARYLNNPDALQRLGYLDPGNNDQLTRASTEESLMNMLPYMLPGNFGTQNIKDKFRGVEIKSHRDMIFRYIPNCKLHSLWSAFNQAGRSIKEKISAVNEAFELYSIGFLLLQVFADLSILNPEWVDAESIPPIGPGAKLPLALLEKVFREKNEQPGRDKGQETLYYNDCLETEASAPWPKTNDDWIRFLHKTLPPISDEKRLNPVNIEHALCEWGKYLSYKYGIKRIARAYKISKKPLPSIQSLQIRNAVHAE